VKWRRPAIAFVNGRVVTPDGGIASSIAVRGARIGSLGHPPSPHDVAIDLDGAFVFPGLINAHDHLELNSFPRLKWRDHHVNVREWIADFQPRFTTDPVLAAARPETLDDRVWVGGLKNLLSGVTTVCHHNPLHRVLCDRFPVRVVRKFRYSHSLQVDGEAVASVCHWTPPDWPWAIHAAEGIDDAASREIETLEELKCLGSQTVLVHGVGITPSQSDRLLARGVGLVWCPSSNHFLFGRTADVRPFAASGRLALGTDSRLSGAGDLFDEMRAAAETEQVSAESIVRAVTADAARMLRLPCAGRLEPGLPADLTIVRSRRESASETLVASTRRDVCLTMVDGQPLVADEAIEAAFDAAGVAVDRAHVDGEPRLLARWIARRTARMQLREPGLEVLD
jgi:cytosine/adenosine deaminase-related metal-dependent hydrolase